MKRRLLARRPSPAMVVAVIALVFSLTGGAIAAGLIGTSDIKKGAVTKKKLHKNAVTSKKVKNDSLKDEDFAPGELKQGVQGLQGLKGDKGEKGDPGPPGPSTGPAGGVLAGNYPDPDFAADARGLALAGVTSGGGASPQALVWFNRLGGAPSISRNSTGIYTVIIPGLETNVTTNVIASGNGPNDDQVSVTSNGGSLRVHVHNAAGSFVDDYFSVTLYGGSSSG